MAIAEVASKKAAGDLAGGAAATATWPGGVNIDDLVTLKGVVWNAGAVTSVGVAKSSGSAALAGGFSVFFGPTGVVTGGGNAYPFLAYGIVTAAGSLTATITPDTSSGNYINSMTDEFSGTDTTTPLDVDGGEIALTSGGVGVVSDTLVTLTDGALIIGVIAVNSSVGAFSPGSGYTLIDSDSAPSIQEYASEFKVVGVAGSYAVDIFWAVSSNRYSFINAAFKPATVIIPPEVAGPIPAQVLQSVMRW